MTPRNLQIGSVKLKSRAALAPMAGITDVVLRQLVRKFSKNCLLTTEMISSEALMQKKSGEILEYRENETPLAFQISGHKPLLMAKAAKMLENRADIIDINMGCPVNKVVKGGDGSALMKNPQLASDIVKAVKDAVNIPVTVKFRLGYTADTKNFLEFAKLMQDSGADAMTIHCRTRSQMYGGRADWSALSDIKKEISVPVFANGDITTPELAKECLEISKVDGVAIARGVIGNPDLIYRIEHFLETGEIAENIDIKRKISLLKEHLDQEIKLRGELAGIRFTRKFYPFYIKGVHGAPALRHALVTEDCYDKIINILDSINE